MRNLHELARLFSRAKNQVDDHVRRKSLDLIAVIRKPISVSLDMGYAGAERASWGTAVKNGNLVSGTAQLLRQGRADEAVSADHEDSHARLDAKATTAR